MKPLSALPLLALAGCSVCQPTRFTWPVFDDPIAALILEGAGGQTSENGPSAVSASPSASTETPSASTETPSASTETPSTPAEPDAETPVTQTPSTPASTSTNDGVGGQQETREESHDRG